MLTSASGAKSTLIPTAASSSPVAAAAPLARPVLPTAPRAIAPGNWVAGGPKRLDGPCSWSVAMSIPVPQSWRAISWSRTDSPARAWGPSAKESVHRK